MRPRRRPALAAHSFLRRADPRTKIALSLAASAAVVLPLAPLLVFFSSFLLLAALARVWRQVAANLRRLAPFLCLLFALDWLFVDFAFAWLITLRLALLASAFSLLVSTTTTDELRAGLEGLGVPHRFAFVFATAFSSLDGLVEEWRGILEAQKARGIGVDRRPALHWRAVADLVPLIVPAVVLTTRRAWSQNEAAAVRGFGAPRRQPHRRPRLGRLDYGILFATAALVLAFLRMGGT